VNTGSAEVRLGTNSNGTIKAASFYQTGGTINCSAGSGVGTIEVTGSFDQSGGTITETSTGNGKILFKGTSSQTILNALGTISNTINFEIDNSNGVNLSNSLTINSSLVFTAGKLTIGNYNLTVSNISGNDASKYIIAEGSGRVIRSISTSTEFPVGTSDYYMPLQMTGSGSFGVNLSNVSSGLTDENKALKKQWNIQEVEHPISDSSGLPELKIQELMCRYVQI
jgi:hypothetical protein